MKIRSVRNLSAPASKIAIPSIVAMLVGALYNIVDQFLGRKSASLETPRERGFPLTTSCVAIALLLSIGAAAAFNLTIGREQRQGGLLCRQRGDDAVLMGTALCILTVF